MDLRQISRQYLPPAVLTSAKRVCAQAELAQFNVWSFLQSAKTTIERPIFMIGCPRSGTTVSVGIFAKHPDVVNKSEAGRVWDPDGYYHPTANHEWTENDVTEENAERLQAYFEFIRRRSGRRRLINKHPRSSVRIDFLEKIFPDALYIHAIRDGRAVAHSIASRTAREEWRHPIPYGNFCKPPEWERFLREDPIEQAALQWREITQYVLDRKAALGERYIEFTYEGLCENPRGTMHDLFAFCDLSSDESVLTAVPEKLQNFNSKYKEDLNSKQIATMEEIQGELLTKLGYDVS